MGEASPNALTNLMESGVLTKPWFERYLKSQKQDEDWLNRVQIKNEIH